jgi:hypothetical protein
MKVLCGFARGMFDFEDPEEEPNLFDDGISPLFGMFQVDLDNFIKTKFALMYHLHIPPGEIEHFPYYEFEMHVDTLIDILKKKKEAEDAAAKESRSHNTSSDAQKAMRNVSKQTSAWKPPSFKMPK